MPFLTPCGSMMCYPMRPPISVVMKVSLVRADGHVRPIGLNNYRTEKKLTKLSTALAIIGLMFGTLLVGW